MSKASSEARARRLAPGWAASARRIGLLALIAAGMAGPLSGVAGAAGPVTVQRPSPVPSTATSPFSLGLPQQAPPQVTTPTTLTLNQAPGASGGLSGGTSVAIGIGALIVLGGIALFIWRDARRRAPVLAGGGAPGGAPALPGSKRKPKRKLSAAERRRRRRGRAPRR